ncbi:MAG: glycoside hydrolase family 95 protein, partial [Phycisphaerales bacterium]
MKTELFYRDSGEERRKTVDDGCERIHSSFIVHRPSSIVIRSVMRLMLLCSIALTLAGCMTTKPAGRHLDGENWESMKLWYSKPAKEWTEALPVGNGRLGAMIFGGPARERLQFNEDTLWTGEPHEYHSDRAAQYLPTVRKLIFEGRQREAQDLAAEHMMSVPLRQEKYQPFGDLLLTFPGHEQFSDYRRQLDIDSAVATVSYRVGDVTFTREVFSSFPDQVIVVRLSCNKPRRLNFTAKLDSPHLGTETLVVNKTLALRGQLQEYFDRRSKITRPSVLKFEARLGHKTHGGSANLENDGLTVRDADSATLVLAAATSFRNFRDVSGDPARACRRAIRSAGRKGFSRLRKRHVADHRRLFRQAAFEVGTGNATTKPTDERIKKFAEQNDPELLELYFQFGRYLMIASSRPGSQPANLQGIWND